MANKQQEPDIDPNIEGTAEGAAIRRTKLAKGNERKKISLSLKNEVLTEAGYRCAVPTCRGTLALNMHHIWEVHKGGGNTLTNLIALCPTCHTLYHNGIICVESIYTWKAMLTAFNSAFDAGSIDDLMFLKATGGIELELSGDGVLFFRRLIAAGWAAIDLKRVALGNISKDVYTVALTQKGEHLVTAWIEGKMTSLAASLGEGTVTISDIEVHTQEIREKRKRMLANRKKQWDERVKRIKQGTD